VSTHQDRLRPNNAGRRVSRTIHMASLATKKNILIQRTGRFNRHACGAATSTLFRSKSPHGFADLPRHVGCRRATALGCLEMVVDRGRRARHQRHRQSMTTATWRRPTGAPRATLNGVIAASPMDPPPAVSTKASPGRRDHLAEMSLERDQRFGLPLQRKKRVRASVRCTTRDCVGVVSAFLPIRCERVRGSYKAVDRGPLGIT
jgi:hypothetical protein